MNTLFLFFIVLFGCQRSPSPPVPAVFADQAMTIEYRILVGDPLSSNQKNEIQQLIEGVFHEIDTVYNKWNPSSELSIINALPAGQIHMLSPQLYAFLERIDTFVTLSEGRFDPTIEPLQQLWKDRLDQGLCPTQEEINVLKPCIGWNTIHFSGGAFYKVDGRTQLDLGGVAKGLCVDFLVERLQSAGFQNLYVEWGGEIRALGMHPAGRPWRIFISNFGNPDRGQAIGEIDLTNQALATSGDYFQYWTFISKEGKKNIYCHIFNPLTLAPLQVKAGTVGSASLLADDCVTADALAKVLMLFETKKEAEEWFHRLRSTYPQLACWIAVRDR